MADQEREIKIVLRGKNLTDAEFDSARRGLAAMNAEVDKQQRAVKGAQAQVGAFGVSWKTALGVIGGLGAVTAAGAALKSMADAAIDNAGALVDMSAKTGLSLGFLQRAGFAAEQTGGSMQQLGDAVLKMSVNTSKGTKDVQDGLRALGLSYDDFRKLRPEQQFEAIVRSLASVDDQQTRSLAAAELFGQRQAGVVLQLVDDYDKLAAAAPEMADANIRALDDMSDAWEKFKRDASNWVGDFLGETVTSGQRAISGWKTFFGDLGATFRGGLEGGVAGAMAGHDAYLMGLRELARAERDLGKATGERTGVQAGGLQAQRDFVKELRDARAAYVELDPVARRNIAAAIELGTSAEDLAQAFGLSEVEVRVFQEQLKASETQQRKSREAAEAVTKELEKQRAALRQLGLVTQHDVNEELGEFNRQLQFAGENGVNMTAFLVGAAPRFRKLAEDAARSGVDLSEVRKVLALIEAAVRSLQRTPPLDIAVTVDAATFLQGMDGVKLANDKAILDARNLKDAYELFGITSRAEAQATAAKYREAYAIMLRSGTATKEELEEAARKLGQAEAAAAGQTRDSWVDAFGAIDSVLGVLERNTTGSFQSIVSAINLGIGAARDFADALSAASLAGQLAGGAAAAIPIFGALNNIPTRGDRLREFAAQHGGLQGLEEQLRGAGPRGLDAWERIVAAMTGKGSAEGSRAAIENARKVLAEFNEEQERAAKLAAELEAQQQRVTSQIDLLTGAVGRFGGVVPNAIDPFIQKLLESGQLTEQQRGALLGLMGDPTWQTLAQNAEKYGISLEALGPKFQNARITETALQYVDDFQMLIDGGGDVSGMLDGMKDEFSDLVNRAEKHGVALPATMKPWLEELAKAGKLVGPDGEIRDGIDGITFADIESEPLKDIRNILQDLYDLFANELGSAARIAASDIERALDRDFEIDVTARVRPEWEDGDGERDAPGRSGGSPNADFEEWAHVGEAVRLHGREAVINESGAHRLGSIVSRAVVRELARRDTQAPVVNVHLDGDLFALRDLIRVTIQDEAAIGGLPIPTRNVRQRVNRA